MQKRVSIKKICNLILIVLIMFILIGCDNDEGDGPNYDIDTYQYYQDTQEQFVRELGAEGMVLLRNNNNALPLKTSDEVVLLGSGVKNYLAGGGGSGWVQAHHIINPLEGMIAKSQEGKIRLNQTILDAYLNNQTVTNQMIAEASNSANTAIIFITRSAAETSDRNNLTGDYYLSFVEDDLIELAYELYDKVIVVLNISGAMDTAWARRTRTRVDGLLISWMAGQEGGHAVADVLVGDVNPSGKLAQTFANTWEDYLSSNNFYNSSSVSYVEDIYVGYRQFETFDPMYSQVTYEFGFGLSYTNFDISHQSTEVVDGKLISKINVKNTGSIAGKEVVQLYYQAPNNILDAPARELAGFAKTRLLKPGESEVVTISFNIADMASYDDLNKIQASAWVLEAGIYQLYVGNSVRNAGENSAVYGHTISSHQIVEQLTQQLFPIQLSQRLTSDGTYDQLVNSKVITVNNTSNLIEAENFTKSSGGISIQKYANDTGSGSLVAYLSTNGAYLEYNLNVVTGGNYKLKFRMANGGNSATDVWNVLVGGSNQNVTVNIEKTGNGANNEWYNFAYTNEVQITLPAGQTTLRLESKVGRATNTDSFILTPISVDETNFYPALSPNTNLGATLPFDIEFDDLYENLDLVSTFVKQLTIDELIALSGNPEGSQGIIDGTGKIGGSLGHKGIPQAESSDGPAGIRAMPKNTYFPSHTLIASTWNLELAKEFGIRVGLEAKKHNISIWLAPGMNIQRNPLGGRNFEYLSEDPYITGMFASAMVNGVQSTGVFATLKHFVANEKEGNRHNSDSRVSERALREIYLKPFEMVIKSENVQFIMTSYNIVNGQKTAERYDLNTTILREEWGFTGVIMSDWWNYNATHFAELASGANVKSWNPDPTTMKQLYQKGLISRDELEQNAIVILKALVHTRAWGEIQTVFDFGYNILNPNKFFKKTDQTIYFLYVESTKDYKLETTPNTNIYINGELIGTTDSKGLLVLSLNEGRIDLSIENLNVESLKVTPK